MTHVLQIHLLFEEVICDCKWYDAKPLQEKLQTLSKDTDFDKIDESDAGNCLDQMPGAPQLGPALVVLAQ